MPMLANIPDILPLFLRLLEDLPTDGAKYLAGAASAWALSAGRKRWRTRRARAFWRPFLGDDLRVVIGRFGEFDAFEQSGMIGLGDARALDELLVYLRRVGHKEPRVAYADELLGDDLKRSIISLGGPDANSVTRDLIQDLPTGVRFGDPSRNEIAFSDIRESGRVFSPEQQPDGRWTDYGLILRGLNPRAPDRHIMIIAGSFGYGTWAGVRHATSDGFVNTRLARAGVPIEVLVSTKVERRTPQSLRVEIARTTSIDDIAPVGPPLNLTRSKGNKSWD